MRKNEYIVLTVLFSLSFVSGFAQSYLNERFEHKIVAGFNLGATAPTSIPEEIRGIEAWWPQFTPQLGYNILYRTSEQWGVGSGISLNYKGMGVKDKVKYIHTRVVIEEGTTRELEGYFVGKNETKTKMAYVTVPLYVSYRMNEKWNFRAGGYASYLFSGRFHGNVSDGYLRVGEPTGEKVDITKANFNFDDDIKTFDFGITLGAEMSLKNRFGIYGNLDWGLTPIFPSNFRAMEFNMYNIYFTFGLTYKL